MNQENKEKEINWKETRLHIRKLIKNNDYTIVEFSNNRSFPQNIALLISLHYKHPYIIHHNQSSVSIS